MLQSTLLLVSYGSSPADAVMQAGNQHLANVLFAGTPLLGQANKGFGLRVFAHLQPPCSSQQCQVGAVGVVLQGVALQFGQARPVAGLPLGVGLL
ncbi:hypothetical protein BV908_08765 [Diaphorobacter sp. LR2014-1]|nr:hypothetical protein BV908_08765 [Diaphorobacter sp. LR2014-1]